MYRTEHPPPRGDQMPRKPPKNKPPIEAISEPRWEPHEPSPKVKPRPPIRYRSAKCMTKSRMDAPTTNNRPQQPCPARPQAGEPH